MAKKNDYPGLSLWANFRPGSHCWFDDHNRTFFNLTWTPPKGKSRYQSIFLNHTLPDGKPNPDVQFDDSDPDFLILKLAKKPKLKIGSIGGKDMFD